MGNDNIQEITDPNILKQFVHFANVNANSISQSIVDKKHILAPHIERKIMQQPTTPPKLKPQFPPKTLQREASNTPPIPHTQQPNTQAPVVDSKKLDQVIEEIRSWNKKWEKILNLIDKKLVNNAKEITIKLRLNEDKNKGQEGISTELSTTSVSDQSENSN